MISTILEIASKSCKALFEATYHAFKQWMLQLQDGTTNLFVLQSYRRGMSTFHIESRFKFDI